MVQYVRLSSNIQPDSVVDGPGIRCVIWAQGCLHKCVGCHNPQTHAMDGGFNKLIDDLCSEIKQIGQNITLSGGDPFFQPEAFEQIAHFAKDIGLNVWAYTGFTWEYICNNPKLCKLLNSIDVLVDGKFDINKKSSECKFRGSTNQRLIDVQKSLVNKSVVLWKDEFAAFEINRSQYF